MYFLTAYYISLNNYKAKALQCYVISYDKWGPATSENIYVSHDRAGNYSDKRNRLRIIHFFLINMLIVSTAVVEIWCVRG